MNPVILIKFLREQVLPEYKTPGSAGFDIRVYPDNDVYVIAPGETHLFSTGLAFSIPQGFEVQIRSRSGMAMKGIVVTNSPGTIDSDYVNEIKVMLTNIGSESFAINSGDRVAQGILSKVEQASFEVVTSLLETDRKGGFGSTGFRDEK